jgi:hypothetical protein
MKSWAIALLLVFAHHSLTGSYDTNARIMLEGTVRDFEFVNPHPFLLVEITRGGKTQRWKMEMDNRSELMGIGMTNSTLKNGDKVTLTGSPGRDDQPILYIWRLDRPADGFWYEQVGSEPKMGTTRNAL